MSAATDTKAKTLTVGGALLAALAASSCCIGPLVMAALGIGGAGAMSVLSAYRPYILILTATLLGGGFYLTYRRPKAVAGDACGCERPRASRAGRAGLWAASVLVVLFAAAPTLLAKVLDPAAVRQAPADPTVQLEQAVIVVQGMDCEACAAHLRTALAKVGGFHGLSLDLARHSVTVSYEPAAGRLDAYVAAIDDLGYEATLGPIESRGPR